MKSFLVIGIGKFGQHLCRSLSKYKCEIMAVDNDKEDIESVLPYVVSAKVGNCTNIDVLRSFDVDKFDCCFVCTGGNFQASLEITDLLKELGAKKIYSKAETDIQAKFLLKNGADAIIFPEKDAAVRLAAVESSDNIFEYVNLYSDYSVFEISCRPSWIGKSIIELNIRKEYDLNILGIKPKDNGLIPNPPIDYVFKEGDHCMVFGTFKAVNRVEKLK
ncbi:MAG: TrkA family potassium uptake protein [Oscillospiraceae bacterium]|nr:TrkA family potassium uptake protein [Oscillospiraceae bacterium]